MIVITSAMREETDTVLACLATAAPVAGACPAWRGDCTGTEVTAVCTGIGRAAVAAGLGGTLADETLAVVSAGFAGALTADLRAGDIVLCETTVAEGEVEPYQADPGLLARAERCGAPAGTRLRRGTGLTVPEVAADVRAKAGLRERTGADVCEMEDYWVAGLAAARELPFLAIRVVLDELTTDISDFTALVGPRGVRLRGAAWFFLTHPRRLGPALRAWRQLRQARTSLRDFMKRFLADAGYRP